MNELLEKQCVGCGSEFSIPVDANESNLYCTSSCEENHSIFIPEVTTTSGDTACN